MMDIYTTPLKPMPTSIADAKLDFNKDEGALTRRPAGYPAQRTKLADAIKDAKLGLFIPISGNNTARHRYHDRTGKPAVPGFAMTNERFEQIRGLDCVEASEPLSNAAWCTTHDTHYPLEQSCPYSCQGLPLGHVFQQDPDRPISEQCTHPKRDTGYPTCGRPATAHQPPIN